MQHLPYFYYTIIVQLLQSLVLVLLWLPHRVRIFSSTYSAVQVHISLVHRTGGQLLGRGLGKHTGILVCAAFV